MARTPRDLSLRRPPPGHSFTLPRALLGRLLIYCGEHGEVPLDVVIDAVDLHLDEIEGSPAADAAASPPGIAPGRTRSGTAGGAPRPPDAIGSASGGPDDRELRAAEEGAGDLTAPAPRRKPPPPETIDLPAFLRRSS